ncbi:SecY-interacting protein [uncultured Paraglaciecola sp.]|uniref:SecY-interacting protein n=1 Tax=uncultured Paraglaciecola sp. TaxID=1765024 RepID=UPI0030DA27D6|tara:strand:+ start:163036 stop:163593 length:558 start_codon:yes stop_codon:yes gene_type:complete
MSEQVTAALDEFVEKYVSAAKKHPEMLVVEYDSDWPSDCYRDSGKTGESVSWQPVKRSEGANFKDLETALEMKIHPDVVSYYSAYWSDNLNAKTNKGYLQLLQPWNQGDFERLQQNLIGHILMKRRLQQPETFFVALTDEDDFILTVNNSSGEVMLEQVGLIPKEVVAPNLAVFIQSLQPIPAQA